MRPDDRAEYGSDFAWPDARGTPHASPDFAWRERAVFCGSGRDAMRILFGWGARRHGWRRVWLPTYYCPTVPTALQELSSRGLELHWYPDAPNTDSPLITGLPVGKGDVVVLVNQLGIRRAPASSDATARGAVIVEDHSHDLGSPWALGSKAHYAVASLRKTVPIPDGGVVWSPRGLPLPPEPPLTEVHAAAALDRISGMVLKARYLAGHAIEKHDFRARSTSGEELIASGPPSGITPVSRAMLASLPLGAWRKRRRENHEALVRTLGPLRHARVLTPVPDAVPFALTVLFETMAAREAARKALIAARVYPAVLWSLDDPGIVGVPAEHIDLGRRVLSIHCDHRYGLADMLRVAEIARPLVAA